MYKSLQIIVFFLVVLLLLLYRNKRIKLANPIWLYLIIWCGTLVLYKLNIFLAFPQLSSTFYFVFITSILSFCIGSSFARPKISIQKEIPRIDIRKLFMINSSLLFIIYISFIVMVLKLGLPPSLGGTISRADYYLSGYGNIYLLIYVFLFFSVYQISQRFRIKRNIFSIVLAFVTILLMGNKFPIFYFIWLVLYFLMLNSKLKLKHILYTFVLILLLFIIAASLYQPNDLLHYYRKAQTGAILKGAYEYLYDPLLYLLCNFMNLNNWLVVPNFRLGFGVNSFGGIIHTLQIPHAFLNMKSTTDYLWKENLQISWLTTGTYLKDIYSDFGIIGILVCPLIYGYISQYLHRKVKYLKNNSSLLSIYLDFLLTFSILTSFFTNYLGNNMILINGLVAIIMIKLITI